jgi:type I restriction enzyme R subunit
VNNVIKGKLLESEALIVQATNNTKAQFANSPTLARYSSRESAELISKHRPHP